MSETRRTKTERERQRNIKKKKRDLVNWGYVSDTAIIKGKVPVVFIYQKREEEFCSRGTNFLFFYSLLSPEYDASN